MIIVNMACGLANRMFQYSYYLYLKKLGYDVYVDFYTAVRLKHENVSWQKVFSQCSCPPGIIMGCVQKRWRFESAFKDKAALFAKNLLYDVYAICF